MDALSVLNLPSLRKLETRSCRKEPIISTPLTFKCILSSRHKDKRGLKKLQMVVVEWGWGGGGGESYVASLATRSQIIMILHLYSGGLPECCLSLSGTSCHRQSFGLETFSRTVYFSNLSLPSSHQGLSRDLPPEPGNQEPTKRSSTKTEWPISEPGVFQRAPNPTAGLFCATYRNTGSSSPLFAELELFGSERAWEGPWRSLVFGKVNSGNRRTLHHSHSHCQVAESSPAFSIFPRPRSNLPSSPRAVAFPICA